MPFLTFVTIHIQESLKFQLHSNTDKERNHIPGKENLILLTFICRGTEIFKKCRR